MGVLLTKTLYGARIGVSRANNRLFWANNRYRQGDRQRRNDLKHMIPFDQRCLLESCEQKADAQRTGQQQEYYGDSREERNPAMEPGRDASDV